jgi:hypothetical protein
MRNAFHSPSPIVPSASLIPGKGIGPTRRR